MTNIMSKTNSLRLFCTPILLSALFSAGSAFAGQYALSVKGSQIVLNQRPVKILGLRCSNALISEAKTEELIANLDGFKKYGVNTVSVFLMGSRYGDIKVEAFTYLNDRFAELLVDPVLERQRRGVCWLKNQKFYYDYSDRFAEILSVNFQGQDRATVISHIKEKRVLRHQGTNKVAKDYGPEDYRAIYELARQQDGRWYIYCLQALADDVPAEGPFECKIETDPNAVNPCTQPQN